MGKKLNKNQMINELVDQFIVVEGEITDLLTRETMQNLNKRYGTNMNGVAVGSALLGQVGAAALSSYAASDEGIDVSDFALELMDDQGQKHYFKGCFPEVIFNKGDQVKVIALPYKPEYGYVSAIIDTDKQYIWTSQQVEKGMLRIRVFLDEIFWMDSFV